VSPQQSKIDQLEGYFVNIFFIMFLAHADGNNDSLDVLIISLCVS
jgi:hypothetical protein